MAGDTRLHLVVPLKVPFNQVLVAGDHFLRLSQNVTGEVLPGHTNDITWVIEDFQEGSLDLVIRPTPVVPSLISAMPAVVHAIASGLRMVERQATRPEYFNDTALYHAKNLARLEGVQVKNGDVGSRLTSALRDNVDQIIGPEQEEWGTVEGRIESMTIHGHRRFNLYEPISGNRIECDFAHRIRTEDIGYAVDKRSAVSGIIVYRGDTVVRVAAEEIEVFPSPEELPTADEVFGILAD